MKPTNRYIPGIIPYGAFYPEMEKAAENRLSKEYNKGNISTEGIKRLQEDLNNTLAGDPPAYFKKYPTKFSIQNVLDRKNGEKPELMQALLNVKPFESEYKRTDKIKSYRDYHKSEYGTVDVKYTKERGSPEFDPKKMTITLPSEDYIRGLNRDGRIFISAEAPVEAHMREMAAHEGAHVDNMALYEKNPAKQQLFDRRAIKALLGEARRQRIAFPILTNANKEEAVATYKEVRRDPSLLPMFKDTNISPIPGNPDNPDSARAIAMLTQLVKLHNVRFERDGYFWKWVGDRVKGLKKDGPVK